MEKARVTKDHVTKDLCALGPRFLVNQLLKIQNVKNKLERKREGGRKNTQSFKKKRSWGRGEKDGAHEVLHTRRDIMERGEERQTTQNKTQ